MAPLAYTEENEGLPTPFGFMQINPWLSGFAFHRY